MDKQQIIEKTVEVLRPFETANIMNTIQTMTFKDLFTNPVTLLIVVLLLYFGLIKRSKAVLLTMFGLAGTICILRYAMPAASVDGPVETSLGSLVPFVVGGVIVGGVIVYFAFIKSE